MAYSTLEDIALDMDETELIQLTDDSGSGVVDSDIVARSIADADRVIDAYVGARYRVPLESASGLVRKLSVDLSVFNLFSRKGAVPDPRKDRHDLALQILEKLAAGKIRIDTEEKREPAVGDVKSTKAKEDRTITMQTMGRL